MQAHSDIERKVGTHQRYPNWLFYSKLSQYNTVLKGNKGNLAIGPKKDPKIEIQSGNTDNCLNEIPSPIATLFLGLAKVCDCIPTNRLFKIVFMNWISDSCAM